MQFYTQLLTSDRGTLAKIWLACHWDKKLTKAQVFECNLEAAIQDIISPHFKLGLRTSGHLLFGVTRIYSRKAKYLLADCNEAVVKIRVAFRPDQLDLPDDMKEARFKSITLPEDFTDFGFELPSPEEVEDIVDNTLNQSRMEDITLKEDIPLVMDGFSVRSLGDGLELEGFGDEEMENTIIEFMMEDDACKDGFADLFTLSHDVPKTPPPTAINHNGRVDVYNALPYTVSNASEMQVDSCSPRPPTPAQSVSVMDETILLDNQAEFFALEPVAVTPRKRARKKRSLIVDSKKELSNNEMRRMLQESDDFLVEVLDLVPRVLPLMEWKIGEGARSLFKHPSTLHPYLLQMFHKDAFPRKPGLKEVGSESDPEKQRNQHQEEVNGESVFATEDPSVLQQSPEQSKVSPQPMREDLEERSIINLPSSECTHNVFSPPYPVSQDSMQVHPSSAEREMPPSVTQTQSSQVSLLSEDVEEKRLTSRAKRLLEHLKGLDKRPSAMFNLQELCRGSSCSRAASMFYSLLVLQKQRAINLHQSAPYSAIVATPGPNFTSF
ncbi:hypothetical protein ACEWY4_000195 [Coilia grayii]|uniref:Uncharacterized protein n=1 Tax=Coilia grayii TaxID=363190 RepID=A0ABD1KVZ0_9TELE